MSILNHRGKFSIEAPLITEATEIIQAVMGQCIIVRCEHNLMTNSLAYEAYSFHFDALDEGETAPAYDIVVTEEGDDTNLQFVRVP